MAEEDINPNVVLTSDNTQYDQAMVSSASTTDQLAKSVDSLGKKIDNIAKTAGKSLVGIAAADVAAITGATAAWASYEKQMSRLEAQAKVVGKSRSEEQRLMKDYTESVKGLRKEYGDTTTEAKSLVEEITKITDNRETRKLKDTAQIFSEMSKATGESSTGLASSLLNLQKVMGNANSGQNETRKYADQITHLSQQTNMSAQGLAEFAAQLAPTARLLGINQTEVTGIATAFAKAGQDGFQAANAFSQMTSNIAYAAQTGSPELSKYANLVGMTVDQFKQMDGSEQILQVFESLNRMGPRAVTELNKLGLDGMRTMRAITAMSQQSGGLRSAIMDSEDAFGSGATKEGAQAAMKGMSDEFAQLREEMKMTAESMATVFGPAITQFIGGFEKAFSVVRRFADGPLGEVAQLVMGLAAPLAAVAGFSVMNAGKLAAYSGVKQMTQGAPGAGFRAGRAGGGSPLPGSSWSQMMMFNAGQSVGGLFPQRDSGPGFVSRAGGMGMSAAGGIARFGGQMFFSPGAAYMPGVQGSGGANDYTKRQRMFSSPTFMGSMSNAWSGIRNAVPLGRSMSGDEVDRINKRMEDLSKSRLAGMTTERQRVERAMRDVIGPDRTANQMRNLDREVMNTTRGLGNMRRGFGNLLGMITGTGVAATRDAARLGGRVLRGPAMRATPFIGGAALLGSGIADQQGVSNTAMLGMTGSLFGPKGAAIGAGAGAIMDLSAQDDSADAAGAAWEEMRAEDAGLRAQWTARRKMLAEVEQLRANVDKSYAGDVRSKGFWTNIGFGGMGGEHDNMAQLFSDLDSALTGESGLEAKEKQADRLTRQFEEQDLVLRDFARKIGEQPLTDDKARAEQLDEIFAALKPQMDEAGITLSDLTSARRRERATGPGAFLTRGFGALTGDGRSYKEMIGEIFPAQSEDLQSRVGRSGATGRSLVDNPLVQKALANEGDRNAQIAAITSEFAGLLSGGTSLQDIVRGTGGTLAEIGDPDNQLYQLSSAVQQRAIQAQRMQMPLMTRTSAFQAQAGELQSALHIAATEGGPESRDMVEGSASQFMQSAVSQGQYFQQLLIRQREFSVQRERSYADFATSRGRMDQQYHMSRSRAQADFARNRKHQEHDYQLSRQRAEADYGLSRRRNMRQFNLSRDRSEADFRKSRIRQEEDYNHQIVLMAEKSAQSMYNIYERVAVQRTHSAEWLMVNASDQMQRMQQQSQNLEQLRGMGMTDDTIQQLGLTDASNQQQLARFIGEVAADPSLVQKFNEQVKERIEAASKLTQDESSTEWQEFQRQYELARDRAMEDFKKSMSRSRKDFRLQLSYMEEDFQKSMGRQAEDYQTAQSRQQEAFGISMKRAAQDYGIAVNNMTEDFGKAMRRAQEDLDRSAQEIGGNLTEILTKSTEKLGGHAGKQAGIVLRTLQGLNIASSDISYDMMVSMAEIFGFPPPKKPKRKPTKGWENKPLNFGDFAQGGVTPGWSPGSDIHHFESDTGGSLDLSGGEAIMVPEWTQRVGGPGAVAEMNRRARSGRFFLGGVMPTQASQITRHSGYDFAQWAGDLNDPGSGDYGDPVKAWKRGKVAQVKDIGDRSYGRYIVINHDGQSSWYAHLSKMAVNPGQDVNAGQYIGAVGNYGNSSGPHLHFEIRGGKISGSATGSGSDGGGPGAGFAFGRLVKDLYPALERAASRVSLNDFSGDDIIPQGHMSDTLNEHIHRFAKPHLKAARAGNSSTPANVPGHDVGGGTNVQIGRRLAAQYGWAGSQWNALHELFRRESGWNHQADNPTSSAYGIPQALMSLHKLPRGYVDRTTGSGAGMRGYGGDPATQIRWGLNYINDRYGSPASALAFHNRNNWYGDGAIVNGAMNATVGERGPEMVLPLDERGADFVSQLMARYTGGPSARGVGLSHDMPLRIHNENHYQIDKSTTFSGPITVAASNPAELVSQLKQRQRQLALANPAMGGKRI